MRRWLWVMLIIGLLVSVGCAPGQAGPAPTTCITGVWSTVNGSQGWFGPLMILTATGQLLASEEPRQRSYRLDGASGSPADVLIVRTSLTDTRLSVYGNGAQMILRHDSVEFTYQRLVPPTGSWLAFDNYCTDRW